MKLESQIGRALEAFAEFSSRLKEVDDTPLIAIQISHKIKNFLASYVVHERQFFIERPIDGELRLCGVKLFAYHDDASKIIKELTKQNRKFKEALREISKETHEANPWTIVTTSAARLAQKVLTEEDTK